MKSSPPKRIQQVEDFLQAKKSNQSLQFKSIDKKECYRFIRKTTWNLKYKSLSRKDKGKIISYIKILMGYSESHTKRLIALAVKGELKNPKSTKNNTSFKCKYTMEDKLLLAKSDALANYPTADALIANFKREYEIFGNKRFVRLKDISSSHVYNIRKTNMYITHNLEYEGTKSITKNEIGIREKPRPDNRPGFLRIDSVHGGDSEKAKGVYYVNIVDEVTQFEMVFCVEQISERFLTPIWKQISVLFPFRILQFHSDNGSEFINNIVANILNKLNIRHSKSRPRRHNDNALVESKNGTVIRKHFGYFYVEKSNAPLINDFLQNHFNNYLNYHRPCAYPVRNTMKNGKVIVKYPKDGYMTPYEKLKLIDPKGKYLRERISYKKIDKLAYDKSDFEYMEIMQEAHNKLRCEIEKNMVELNN